MNLKDWPLRHLKNNLKNFGQYIVSAYINNSNILVIKTSSPEFAARLKYEEQEILKKILNSNFKNYCKALDDLTISETLPIIKNCNLAVCNDTSFSHLSAALEIETIVLMTDSPLLYGSYSPKMHPIIPDGEKTVTHNTLGKDKINPEKIFNKMKEILKLS